jgi:hypothetical protein
MSAAQQFKALKVAGGVSALPRERYSVTSDVLSYRRCGRLYGFESERGFIPSQPTQRFVGTIIHQVLDRAHSHYGGRLDPKTKGTVPSDAEIEEYFTEVESSLRAHGIRAVNPTVRNYALTIVGAFNRIEGPTLYPLVKDTEHRLQSERGNYLLYGVVDVLAGSTTGGGPHDVEIWDYKGTKAPKPGSKQGARLLKDYEFQMQVYSELYRLRNGQTPTRAIVYFVGELGGKLPPKSRPSRAVLEVTLSASKSAVALKEFDATVGDIRQASASNQWLAPPGGSSWAGKETCDLCDVRWSCPVMGASYRTNPRYP